LWTGIAGRRFGGYVSYIDTNLLRKQGSPLNPHCNMWAHMWRKQWKTGKLTLGAFLDNEGVFGSTSFDIIIDDAKWHGLGDMI
jgi:hypothetical protein